MLKRIKDLFVKIVYILNKPQKTLGIIVLIMTFLGALLECIGVSIIVPLVNVILNPNMYINKLNNPFLANMLNQGYSGVVIFVVGLVILVYVLKNLFFIFLSWFRIKYACKVQREIAIRMMKSYMSRGYEFFLNTSYGELSRGVSGDVSNVYIVISSGLRLLADVITIFLICIFMLYTDYLLSLAVITMSGICVALIYFVFRRSMQNAGVKYREYTAKSYQSFYQAFQGIKEVLVLRRQNYFVSEYERNMIQLQLAQCKQTVGAEAPAYIIEGMCISGMMIIVAYKMIIGGNTEAFVATLAAFAVGAFRILPSLGRISVSINQVMTNTPSINAVYNDIKEAEHYSSIHPAIKICEEYGVKNIIHTKPFNEELELKDVWFSYRGSSSIILKGLNLSIKKGQSIGIKGTSGAGKSTLVDVLLGLLIPQHGEVIIDGASITDNPDNWSNLVGYVAQSIFLCDGSIRENVAFGCSIDEVEDRDVLEALERAELRSFVESLPDGLDTQVGDRGIRLSGGQRQRIAIARALYHKPEILVMDEATSALDNETEKAIMDAIDSLQGSITMIIVAHRLTTIKNCDVIYEVSDGTITIVDKSSLF